MKRNLTLIFLLFSLSCMADGKYFGGDISLLKSYIDHGAIYLNQDGARIYAPLSYFCYTNEMNTMRVRLFVNPENASDEDKGQGVVQDLEYVKELGHMIKDLGMAFMLDFHYSDSWADPAKQWTPKAWSNLNDQQLYDKIYDYTKEVLEELKAAGAAPDFIQTGNEISYGMLWGPVGTSSPKKCYAYDDNNWPRFTNLLKRAIQACRETCPQAQIIIHTERVAQPDYLKAFYDKMSAYGVEYDIIGLSYYSYYHGPLASLETALTRMESNYPDKKIMLVEVGYYHDWQPNNVTYDLSATYPISGQGQKAFAEDLIALANNHAQVNGLFWWFMEANENGLDWDSNRVTDNWYNAGLFDNQTGRAEPALYVLKDFLGGVGIHQPSLPSVEKAIYSIDGRRMEGQSAPLHDGIYIKEGKKYLKK